MNPRGILVGALMREELWDLCCTATASDPLPRFPLFFAAGDLGVRCSRRVFGLNVFVRILSGRVS